MTHQYILGLGSNIEAPYHIEKAKEALAEKFKILKESRFIHTQPIDLPGEPDFLNGAILIQTDLEENELHHSLKALEKFLGRNPIKNPKSGSRPIDIDILVKDSQVVHSDFYKRDFVKSAVLEILPSVKF